MGPTFLRSFIPHWSPCNTQSQDPGLAPIPSISVAITAAVKPGFLRNMRKL
jgi:hypothetical protein